MMLRILLTGLLLIQTTSTSTFRAISEPALPNAHQVTDKVICGAQPDGDAGFAALQRMGIETIISVDGSAPDVERAHKYGLHYVHLPIAYEGVTTEQGHEIAKALEEEPGPIYIHCHHGKHRSAAAVAVGCIENGTLDPNEGEAVLQTMGTGANFKGLWAAARDGRPLTPEELKDVKVNYVEIAKLAELPGHMVMIDQHWDNVKLAQAAGWKTPANHPEIDPAAEVLQVQEHLHEAGRLKDIAARPDDFKQWLQEADSTALKLQELLNATKVDAAQADGLYKQVNDSCTACHKAYRDSP